ncbi:efflux RND transporter periplasmic adaptor subunit [Pseudoalteromonas sp. B62]|uniref:efflux RND transporter periplasmic adaptor subunit n=1 Tax=Pseudoalteromonas sp. B62 TaxID=630483 RepID=UPI00301CD4E8
MFAPYNGQVINKTANLAQTVNANQEILEIQTDSELREVTISVPESLINLFSQGMSAQIEFSALSSTAVSGKVVRIGKQALGMAAFPVTILLSDVPEALVNGMTASVSIDFRITNNALTLTIPRSSLVPDNNNEYYVFVVDEEANHVRKRSVNLEKLSNEFALVNSGVSAGEIIIAKGAIFLSEGQSISLLSQDIRNFPE